MYYAILYIIMAKKRKYSNVPVYTDFYLPLLKALKQLGGSGSIQEINEIVYELFNFSDEVLQIPHEGRGNFTEVEYRLAWARTYLKKYGVIDNSSRGVWALNNLKIDIDSLSPEQISKTVRENEVTKTNEPNSKKELHIEVNEIKEVEEVDEAEDWKQQLLNLLYNIHPSAFERLSQRLLRETGFSHVEVTGKTGDGGIDGKGIVKINGVLSFHMIFQCKRYKGSISPSQIRDFRGAMQGRADKGIFITTGSFTREAIKEATRDGAPPIDLVDGNLLCERLKELQLGVNVKLIEKVDIDNNWFERI
jgi:restriction system protein